MNRPDAMQPFRTEFRVVAVAMLAIGAAGCGSGFSGLSLPGSNGQTASQVQRPAQPPISMAGRWMLAQPGRGQCNMTFRASAEGIDGTIAPEGGCPGKFFTSRRWSYDSNGLTIQDHNSQTLAQLSNDGGGRFEGKAATGDTITLTR